VFTDCSGNVTTAYTTCIAELSAYETDCSDPVQAELDICTADAEDTRTICITESSDANVSCVADGSTALSTNLSTAASEFANIMSAAVEMTASCPDGPLCSYGPILESLALTLFMNQCFVADLVYQTDIIECTNEQSTNDQNCELAYSNPDDDDGNVQTCNNTAQPGFDDCIAAFEDASTTCTSQQTDEQDICQELFDTAGCSEAYTENVQTCIDYRTNSQTLCGDGYTQNFASCNSFLDDANTE
jgi:hypothetical protein